MCVSVFIQLENLPSICEPISNVFLKSPRLGEKEMSVLIQLENLPFYVGVRSSLFVQKGPSRLGTESDALP